MRPSAGKVFVLDPSAHNFSRALLGLFFSFFEFYLDKWRERLRKRWKWCMRDTSARRVVSWWGRKCTLLQQRREKYLHHIFSFHSPWFQRTCVPYYSNEGTRILTLHSALNRRSRAVSVESPAAVTPHHSLKWVVVRFASGLFITSRIINLDISLPTTPASEATVISVGTRNCKIKK